jgi:hypothetical protein
MLLSTLLISPKLATRSRFLTLISISLVLLTIRTPDGTAQIAKTPVKDATNGVQSMNIAKPANLLKGDVLIAIVASSFAYGGVPTPAGWTLIQSIDQGAQIIQLDTYYHVVEGSEPPSWSWQLGIPATPNARATGSIIAYRGVNTTSPIAASETRCCKNGTSTTVASINTIIANNLVLAVFAEGQSNSAYTPPTILTGVTNVSNGEPNWGNHHMFGEFVMTNAGATGHQIAKNGKDTGADVAQLIALVPSSLTAPTRVGVMVSSAAALNIAPPSRPQQPRPASQQRPNPHQK